MNTKKHDSSHQNDCDPDQDWELFESEMIADIAFDMSGAREKYEAEQAEREFMEDVGDLSREELLGVLREERAEWERMHVRLYQHSQDKAFMQAAINEFEQKKEQAKRARLDARNKKKEALAATSEEAIAFGVPDFGAIVRDALLQLDNSNKRNLTDKEDGVKKVRQMLIDLIISGNRSTLELSRIEVEKLTKKYLTAAKLRVYRNQIKRGAHH